MDLDERRTVFATHARKRLADVGVEVDEGAKVDDVAPVASGLLVDGHFPERALERIAGAHEFVSVILEDDRLQAHVFCDRQEAQRLLGRGCDLSEQKRARALEARKERAARRVKRGDNLAL
jgi:hypothetical protein